MAPAGPREPNNRLDRGRAGRSCRIGTRRQRWQFSSMSKKEAEGIGGQRGGRFSVIELATADLIVGCGGEYPFDFGAGNPGKKARRRLSQSNEPVR